jgi:lactoylglutathione lyase
MLDFDHVGLSVADLDAILPFYRDGLDLELEFQFEIPEQDIRAVFLRNARGFGVELLERTGSSGGLRASDHHDAILTRGYGHMCLRVDDLEAAHQKLLDVGASTISPPGPAPGDGVRFAYLSDPEGNLIELIQFPNHG